MQTIRWVVGAWCATLALTASAQDRDNLLQARDRVEWDAGGLYEGRFTDGTPFQIDVPYPAPAGVHADGKNVMEGAYWYPRRFTGQVLTLTPRRGAGDVIELVPVHDTGAQSGERFALTLDDGKRGGTGSWTSATLGRQLTFSLKRLVLYRAVALSRLSPEALAEGSDRQFSFTALFPVLPDGSVDDWVRTLVAECSADLECSNKVLVRWHSPTQMSLQASTWTYSYGAAHGQYRSAMRHYTLGSGAPVHTRFTNFVAAGTACRDKVSTALVAKLRARGLSWPEQGALADLQEPKFLPTSSGIAFHWDPYEVGSYAQGAPSVFLTREELGQCVSKLPGYD